MNRITIKLKIKHIIYLGLSLIYRYLGFQWLTSLFGAKRSLTVLMYHKVNDHAYNPISVSVRSFENQICYLKDNFKILSPEEVLDCVQKNQFPPNAVLITFDDGYQDNLTNAYPILKKHNLRALLFIPTDFPGSGKFAHDEHVPYHNPTLTWDEIQVIQDVFQIASHGCSHQIMTSIPFSQAVGEIKQSKEILESHLGGPVTSFSYPKGSIEDFNVELEEFVKNEGYSLAFTTIPLRNKIPFNQWRIQRYNIEDFGMTYFKCLLNGAGDILSLKDTRFGYQLKKKINYILGTPSK